MLKWNEINCLNSFGKVFYYIGVYKIEKEERYQYPKYRMLHPLAIPILVVVIIVTFLAVGVFGVIEAFQETNRNDWAWW